MLLNAKCKFSNHVTTWYSEFGSYRYSKKGNLHVYVTYVTFRMVALCEDVTGIQKNHYSVQNQPSIQTVTISHP